MMNSFDLMIERYKKEMREFDEKVNARNPIQKKFLKSDELSNELNDELNNELNREFSNNSNDFSNELDEIMPVFAAVQTPQTENEIAEPNFNSQGSLIIQAFMSSEVYPIVSALVKVSKNESDDIFFEGYTDVNGKTEQIMLPAPSAELSQQPSNIEPYALYDIEVSQPKYKTRKYIAVPVFAGVESIQPVQLVPVFSSNVAQDVIVTRPPTLGGEYNGW